MGEEPATAALRGRSEIGLAAISITLVDVIVFLPVSFMTGNIGRLFKEFGITIAAATLFSLFVSFTLTPMLASRWLQPGHEQQRPAGALRRVLGRGYDQAGRRLPLAAGDARSRSAGCVVLLSAALLCLARIMMLQHEHDRLGVRPARGRRQLPGQHHDAAWHLARRHGCRRSGESRPALADDPEVQNVFTSVGGGGGFGGGGGTRSASMAVQLKDKATASARSSRC